MHTCAYLEWKLLWPKNLDKNGKHIFVKGAAILKIMVGLHRDSLGISKKHQPQNNRTKQVTYLG